MTASIHELEGWPRFGWRIEDVAEQLASVRHRQGRLLGRMEALGFESRAEAVLQTLTEDVHKARFWKAMAGQPLNERQRKVVDRLLDGFEGKLTSSKWAVLAKTSPGTALRDITDLVTRGILLKNQGGGRSTSYSLARLGGDEPPRS